MVSKGKKEKKGEIEKEKKEKKKEKHKKKKKQKWKKIKKKSSLTQDAKASPHDLSHHGVRGRRGGVV